jgi:hypothetical protein
MALTPPGPFERCAPESADNRCARRGPDRREDTGAWSGGARPLINEELTKHGRFNEDGLNVLAFADTLCNLSCRRRSDVHVGRCSWLLGNRSANCLATRGLR